MEVKRRTSLSWSWSTFFHTSGCEILVRSQTWRISGLYDVLIKYLVYKWVEKASAPRVPHTGGTSLADAPTQVLHSIAPKKEEDLPSWQLAATNLAPTTTTESHFLRHPPSPSLRLILHHHHRHHHQHQHNYRLLHCRLLDLIPSTPILISLRLPLTILTTPGCTPAQHRHHAVLRSEKYVRRPKHGQRTRL